MKTIAAAALLIGAALSTAAYADMNYGPMTNGGKCWKTAKDAEHSGFGYWDACAAPAATAAHTATAHHVHHHQKKS
jgi:hypothetical protein